MNRHFEQILITWLGLIALIICLWPKGIVLGIAGLAVLVIYGYVIKKISFQWSLPALTFIALYAVYFIGTFFTNHQSLANHYIESKLSFVVFPVLLSFRFTKKVDWRPVVIGLTAGIIGVSIIGFANAATTYGKTGQLLASFTSSNFSNIHHPSYLCVFILTAAALLWHGYRQAWKGFSLKWMLPVYAYFFLIYGLCLSLAGILLLFILTGILIARWIYRRFGKKVFFGALIVLPALCIPLFLVIPQMKQQFSDASKYFLEFAKSPSGFVKAKQGYKEGNEVRLIMWTVATEEFMQHPFGVGTGNVDDHLSYRLTLYGQTEMAKKDGENGIQYNPHNQFLQTALEIGVVGLLLLFTLFSSILRFAWKHRNYALLIMTACLVFNALFESMFQRQSGIVFFSFWICLLIVYSHSQQKDVA